jgi:dipeptidyl aminopeptidase/acylaminoacyl peptidase
MDVADVISAAPVAREQGWAGDGPVVAMGGSAGGFTVLHALAAAPDVFAAGIVLYPVTDLDALDATTHRFERHYSRTLVGPVERNAERSPARVVDAITAPLLVLHGDADKVVHPSQSQMIVDRLSRLGRDVTLHVYEGEGHGWKRAETTVDELDRIDAFLTRVAARSAGPSSQAERVG